MGNSEYSQRRPDVQIALERLFYLSSGKYKDNPELSRRFGVDHRRRDFIKILLKYFMVDLEHYNDQTAVFMKNGYILMDPAEKPKKVENS